MEYIGGDKSHALQLTMKINSTDCRMIGWKIADDEKNEDEGSTVMKH